MADDLRHAGLTVVEHDGWRERSHGAFSPLAGVVWHHDASPEGDSPGEPEFLCERWDADKPSANAWVSREGVWHLIGAGVAWHAGEVLPGKLSNQTSLGIETDHTLDEPWPAAQLSSLRHGTAVLLRRTTKQLLEFHKTICDPPGRKIDPAGLDLDYERRQVAGWLHLHQGQPGYRYTHLPLRRGDHNVDVGHAQHLLIAGHFLAPANEYGKSNVDNDFGPRTQAATRRAQAKHGQHETGTFDAALAKVLG